VRLIDDFLYITTNLEMAKRLLPHCSFRAHLCILPEFLFLFRFVLDMHKGYPSHGCTVNTLKTQVNFEMAVDGSKLNNVSRQPGGIEPSSKKIIAFFFKIHAICPEGTGPVLSWCGLLINTKTLHIKADYTRYVGSCTIALYLSPP